MDELIDLGEKLPLVTNSRITSFSFDGDSTYENYQIVSRRDFVVWKTSCLTILDQVVSAKSIHRATVSSFHGLNNNPDDLDFGISFLASIRSDLESGFFENIALEIEAEIAADYMGQAEELLSEGSSGKYDHVPAAVLAGAVLEKSLKTICGSLAPAEPVTKKNGDSIKLNALIDAIKNRGVCNENMAKQLRAWAAIRNSAAHGNFNEFSKEQVGNMITGINIFLSEYL